METVIFKSGNSQAVRIPREFRLTGKAVDISRCGNRLIIKEKKKESWDTIVAMPCDADFILERPDNISPQKRDLF
jgi:antitoxin VapB